MVIFHSYVKLPEGSFCIWRRGCHAGHVHRGRVEPTQLHGRPAGSLCRDAAAVSNWKRHRLPSVYHKLGYDISCMISIYLSIYRSIYLSIDLSIDLSIYLPIYGQVTPPEPTSLVYIYIYTYAYIYIFLNLMYIYIHILFNLLCIQSLPTYGQRPRDQVVICKMLRKVALAKNWKKLKKLKNLKTLRNNLCIYLSIYPSIHPSIHPFWDVLRHTDVEMVFGFVLGYSMVFLCDNISPHMTSWLSSHEVMYGTSWCLQKLVELGKPLVVTAVVGNSDGISGITCTFSNEPFY